MARLPRMACRFVPPGRLLRHALQGKGSCRPRCGRSGVQAPLLEARAGRRAMGFRVGRADPRRGLLPVPVSQAGHDPGEDAPAAPPLPTVAGLFRGRRGAAGATVPLNCQGLAPLARPATASHGD